MQILFDYNISDSFICKLRSANFLLHHTQHSMDSASKQGLCAHMHQTLRSKQVKDPLMTSQDISTCSSLEQCMCENSVDIFLFLVHFVISVELRKKAITPFLYFLTDFLLLRKPHLLSRTCSPRIKTTHPLQRCLLCFLFHPFSFIFVFIPCILFVPFSCSGS